MSIQHIRYGYLLSQESDDGLLDHSIVVQKFEGGVSIMQATDDIYIEEGHVDEFIKILRAIRKEGGHV